MADVLVEDERGVISVPVRGIPIGEHLLVHCRRGEWVMTHRTTGRRIAGYRDGHEAVRQALILEASGAELGEAYDAQAIEEIRGQAELIRWEQAESEVKRA